MPAPYNSVLTKPDNLNCCLYVFAVIANQCAHWCGNPPAPWNQVTITTKNRKVFPLCRAIVDTFYL